MLATRIFSAVVVGLAAGWAGASAGPVQADANLKAEDLAAAEKEACTRNLKKIYEAIQAYELDHKDLPNWLSDLVPQYLADASVLVCPVCRRTGKIEQPPLADPKIASSYLFEFCPVPLGAGAPNAPNRTRREWKRRQMGLVGSVVPIVRCRHHTPVLNLAYDGQVYDSPVRWELAFTNRVSAARLTATNLFADEPAGKPPTSSHFPRRDAKAGPGLLDLTKHYNAGLHEAWLGRTNTDFGALPLGIQRLAGVDFDVRGVLQLAGRSVTEKKYPPQIKGIAVHQQCKQLHFLHAACFVTEADHGKQAGSYYIHFAGSPTRLEIPIRCGQEVGDCRSAEGEGPLPEGLSLAWISPAAPEPPARHVRLFTTTWTNLAPEVEIESIDFVSPVTGPAPFLVAITAE